MSTLANIQVFLRVRPSARPSNAFTYSPEDNTCHFEFDKETPDGQVNNSKLSYKFKFNHIFGMDASQEQVFDLVAKPVIQDVLTGVNGTIFAYGQTGSGKTFTITGGAERYSDRGLIPRTISLLFDSFKKATDMSFRMYISYLEIYNDAGYDLLREDGAAKLEDLPKVSLREDEDGNIHLRNLSVNLAGTEEDALNLLFMGDTNRVVAETPMNDASTRSHCMFIIWIDSTKIGGDTVRRSKLHLVDLAGSERVSKTGVDGKLLSEAKHINLSLHYLEQVIVALHERTVSRGNTHVPYRNSMMTSVLRDSLGGNCKTTMVATGALEPSNVDETISTCRFAQRVAQIKNNAKVNEELDPSLMIKRLKREVAELKEEVRLAKGGEEPEELPADEIEECKKMVFRYVSPDNEDPNAQFSCGSLQKMRECFKILRNMTLEAAGGGGNCANGGGTHSVAAEALEEEARQLRLHIAQRDQEISVFVQMLNKRNSKGDRPFIAASSSRPPPAPAAPSGPYAATGDGSCHNADAGAGGGPPSTSSTAKGPEQSQVTPKKAPTKNAAGQAFEKARPVPVANAAELILNPGKAFEVFRTTIHKNPQAFEDNKDMLRKTMMEAKGLGEKANAAKAEISKAKTTLEKLRTERAFTSNASEDEVIEDGPEELEQRKLIDHHKGVYQQCTNELRRVKGDIDRIQQLLEQNRVRMQKDFEKWFKELKNQSSVKDMDEEEKAKLYQQVTGQAPPAPPPAKPPPGPGKGAGGKPRDAAVTKDIDAFYAALDQLGNRR